MRSFETYEIKKVDASEIDKHFLCSFIRDETISRVWRTRDGKKELVDVSYREHWNKDDLEEKSLSLIKTLNQKGVVVVVLDKKNVIGFAAIEGKTIGMYHDYHQLSQFHISNQYRKKGVGRALFKEVERIAHELQIKKLYISSSSSEHTLRFYQRNGCIDAQEVDEKLSQREPYDIPLEYGIKDKQ